MNIISCKHKRALKLPACEEYLDASILDVARSEETIVITFAKWRSKARTLTAIDRLHVTFPGDVVCSYWDRTPLAAHLLWDAAHAMKPGARVYLHVSDYIATLLSRDYYRESFCEEQSTANGLRVFRKIKALSIEKDRGLEGWSFCIPTGGNSAAQLNCCVERILSLGIPQSEIILCGEPGDDFRFWNEVRIVGKDITGMPVPISRKKNILAQNANYSNLCILHDRVLLPHEFMQAMTRFGDDFPFIAFQSFWFADYWRASPRRYSDFCVGQFIPSVLYGETRLQRQHLPEFERMRHVAQHPERAAFGSEYLTGSLYICKRSLWRAVPQNELLNWGEYEDVEQGIHASVSGIPSRINPYAFTETLSYRSIFHCYGTTRGLNKQGKVVNERAPMELWGFTAYPALNITQENGIANLSTFALRYLGNDENVRMMT
ncbi:hypothetical protein INF70_21820, partial [Enterobacter cloacae complex sp. P4RS]